VFRKGEKKGFEPGGSIRKGKYVTKSSGRGIRTDPRDVVDGKMTGNRPIRGKNTANRGRTKLLNR